MSASGFVKGTGAGVTLISFTTNTDGCVATRTVTVNACRQADTSNTTSVSVPEMAGEVRLFPNPNKGVFTLSGHVNAATGEEVYIEVVNTMGQTVFQSTLLVQDSVIDKQIDLPENLANGIYLLSVHCNGQNSMIRFVVTQ